MNRSERACCANEQEMTSSECEQVCGVKVVPNPFFQRFDDFFQANLAKMTSGMSPAALDTTYYSWLSQLRQSPGRLFELAFYPLIHADDCVNKVMCSHEHPGDGDDVRFHKESWQYLPWRWFAEGFLLTENWWRLATTDIPGLPNAVERAVSFTVRQVLDSLSPSNFFLTNPELFHETLRTGGLNLIHGTELAVKDVAERWTGIPPAGVERFVPGETVAITPGRVVYQNHLIELIQYEPQTKTVFKEPLLIVPAWIMKYYILDLSPENSMVKWLVAQGHTVFMISWRNPVKEDNHLGLDDYYRQGVMSALDKISTLVPQEKIHLMGYCLGGTLAMIAAAAMAQANDQRIKSLTLLAAQGDFTDAGELMLFVTESQVAFLKNMMQEQGYLDTKQMAGTFQMLRSYDLIWSKMIQDYMEGKERGMIDLMAWNADATRMPYKMHSEYLEKLFLHNDFAEGRFSVEGNPVVPENIHVPVFAVSTEKDHVAPWQSVFKIHLMIDSTITFVLANGGHNAGIVSEPGHPKRFYRIHEHKQHEVYLNADNWLKVAEKQEGSWWLAWHDWLVEQSTPERVAPPIVDASLPAAPGTYVLQK